MFRTPTLTPARIRFAYAIAITADLVQIALGPVGWALPDEIIDVIAMFLTWRAIGFHPLLLPTFVAEFIPLVDMLPTWTACVALVVSLRRKNQEVKPPSREGPVIDV